MALQDLQQDARAKAEAYQPRGKRLHGQIVVVTGGDSGIGQATALACAMEGAAVAVSYHRDREGAEQTREQAEAAGAKATCLQLDQGDPDQVKNFFEQVRDAIGTPTILVNNAGVDARGTLVEEMEVEEWDEDLRVNLSGPFYCAREFLRMFYDEHGHVRDEEPPEEPKGWTRGVIVNVSSIHDTVARAGASTYDCAKGGLRNLMRTLALELARERIRVVNVAPGMVLTPFNRESVEDESERRKQVKSIPVRRAALPDEIASAIVFLASDDASYVHGTTLVVDGGLMQNQGQGA